METKIGAIDCMKHKGLFFFRIVGIPIQAALTALLTWETMEKCQFIDTSRLMIRLFWGWDGIHFKGFNFDVVYYFDRHFHLLACFTTFLRGDVE